MGNDCNHKIVIQYILNENELDLNSVNGLLYAATGVAVRLWCFEDGGKINKKIKALWSDT